MSTPGSSPDPSLTTRTVTFLFTDIEGSTRLWEQHPEGMRHALARHDRLLRQVIEEHEGRVFKTVGDAFCAAFPNAPAALAAALEAQRAMRRTDWGEVGAMRVRVALHTGTAEQRDDDYFGPSLSRVARILAAAHGGQTLLSSAVEERVRDGLPGEVRLRDLGVHRLRYLAKPEQIYQVTDPEAPGDFPPLRAVAAFAHNLPLQLTSFIGREREMGEVRRLLSSSRLVTLTGPGGGGKTRLAMQTAEEMTGQYSTGVWMVDLAPLAEPTLICGAIASVVKLREEPGRNLEETILDYLRDKDVLLVLDNCEHLVAGCAGLVERLLRSCPPLRILATSREPLSVPGEAIFGLPPLGLPPPGSLPGNATPSALARYESVRLFTERAAAANPAFSLSEENAAAVAQICRRLDGIPLALELAAARVRAMPPQQMAARLDDCFRILTGGARTAPDRQQTLRAAIDWSYALLTEQERAFLRRLAVFSGTFTLEAAEAVVSGRDATTIQLVIDEWEVFDLLSRLVDKSLVAVEAGPGGEARYRLLETIRQYSKTRLLESGELDCLTAKHGAYYRKYVRAVERELQGQHQALWLTCLDWDHDNLRAALGFTGAGDEETLRLAADLWRFWYIRGHLSEGLTRLRETLSACPLATEATRATALTGAGNIAWALGHHEEARDFHREALSLRRTLGDRPGVASSLNNLGLAARHSGNLLEAQQYLEQSAAAYRALGEKGSTATVLLNLSGIAIELGQHEQARHFLMECLPVHEGLGAWNCVSQCWQNLGLIEEHSNALAAAGEALQRSLRLKLDLKDLQGCAGTLECLARIALRTGDYREAAHLFAVVKAAGDRMGVQRAPQSQGRFDAMVAALREHLGPEELDEVWREGECISVEDAAAKALNAKTLTVSAV